MVIIDKADIAEQAIKVDLQILYFFIKDDIFDFRSIEIINILLALS